MSKPSKQDQREDEDEQVESERDAEIGVQKGPAIVTVVGLRGEILVQLRMLANGHLTDDEAQPVEEDQDAAKSVDPCSEAAVLGHANKVRQDGAAAEGHAGDPEELGNPETLSID
jgi:hypothetical protein